MRTLLLLAVVLAAAPASAAPIYGDVSIEGGIHFVSVGTFEGAVFWTPAVTTSEVLTNPIALPTPTFDGKYFRVDLSFPDRCGGTFQVDAWWHGGWFGELRANGDTCDPPVCTTCGGGGGGAGQSIAEPSAFTLLACGFAWMARRKTA